MRAKLLLAAVLSLIVIAPAAAAFTRVQGATHSNGSTSSTTVVGTLPAPATGGDMIAISVGWASTVADTITIQDDKGDSFAIVDKTTVTSFYFQSAYFLNVTPGAQVFTATISTARQFASIWIDEFSGVAGTAALDGHAINFQTGPTVTTDSITSTAITPTTNGDLIYGATVNLTSVGSQSPGSVPNVFTQAQLIASLFLSEYLTQATAALISATMTPSASDNWITYVMAFKAGVAAPVVGHLRLLKGIGP